MWRSVRGGACIKEKRCAVALGLGANIASNAGTRERTYARHASWPVEANPPHYLVADAAAAVAGDGHLAASPY